MIYLIMKRTTIFLADEDKEAITVIRGRFGLSTDSDAIRFAVRIVAQATDVHVSPLPPFTSKEQTNDQAR